MTFSLFLLNKKGYVTLEELLKSSRNHSMIDQVITAEDKGNKEDYSIKIASLCKANNIPVFNRRDSFIIESEYSIAIGWRWMLYDVANLIVIHDSLLPKYRGFSPLVNMLINGEKIIGATAIFGCKRMDEGDIILLKKREIQYPIKIEEAINLMAVIYAKIALQIFEMVAQKKELPRMPQNHGEATYSIWRDSNDYQINWSQDAKLIERFINAVGFPYDGAQTFVNGLEPIKILDIEVKSNFSFEIESFGKILMFEDKKPIVACGKKAIKILHAEDSSGNPYVFSKLRTRLT